MELSKQTEKMLRAHGFEFWWKVSEDTVYYRKQVGSTYYALRIEHYTFTKTPSIHLWEFLNPKTNLFSMKDGTCFVSIRTAVAKTDPPKELPRKFSAATALAVPFP